MSARPLALVLVILLTACTPGGPTEVVGPGAVADPPPLDVRADRSLDLTAVEAPDRTPPRAVTLEHADWPQVAAWLRRETSETGPVLVNFFASYCEPCVRELPLLLATADAQPDVTFLGVHTAEQVALGARMVEEFGIDLPTFTDPSRQVLDAVGGRVLPYTIVFDADGRLVGRVFGELTERSLTALLAEVRGGGTPRPSRVPP